MVSDSLGLAPLSLPVGLSSRSKKESSSSAVAARAEEEEEDEGAAVAEDVVGRERRGFQDRGASPPPVSSGVGFCWARGEGG